MKLVLFFLFLDILWMRFLVMTTFSGNMVKCNLFVVGILVAGENVGVVDHVPMNKIPRYFMENTLLLKISFMLKSNLNRHSTLSFAQSDNCTTNILRSLS